MLNAANEIAVEAFLNGRIGFTGIATVVGATLAALPAEPVRDLDQLLAVDRAARDAALRSIAERA